MSPAQPEGQQPPTDGHLPRSAAQGADDRTFSVYVHVPYCEKRCGYCDFNTYTIGELNQRRRDMREYRHIARREIGLAARALITSRQPIRPVSTVFFGGGTPTMLPVEDLVGILADIDARWGLADNAEITTEANPDSVDASYLTALAEAGFTRVSFGMQSSVKNILATLDRTHSAKQLSAAVHAAHDRGLATSVDLIYGTPGETIDDWKHTMYTALDLPVDHISAYALTVENGTKLAAQVKRGVLDAPNHDDQATKYDLADQMLENAGFTWYEISNWSRDESFRSRHNLAYWHNQDWWGIGPGAHSHIGGVRWWNVKHPADYAKLLQDGVSPAKAREELSPEDRALEDLMLRLRTHEGLPHDQLGAEGMSRLPNLAEDGLVFLDATHGTIVLTRRGRMLADLVVRDLMGW